MKSNWEFTLDHGHLFKLKIYLETKDGVPYVVPLVTCGLGLGWVASEAGRHLVGVTKTQFRLGISQNELSP